LKLSAQITHDIHDAEPPPIMGRWRNINIAVLLWLAFLIALFYGFTQYFS
jgi:hypothetical protein